MKIQIIIASVLLGLLVALPAISGDFEDGYAAAENGKGMEAE